MRKLVKLTGEDIIVAALWADKLQGTKEVLEKHGLVQNRNVCGMDDFQMHYIGKLGERVLERELGVRFRRDLTRFGDGGSDFEIYGFRVQAKTASYTYERHLTYVNT